MSKRFITKYIRKKYRYRGLIITDDMRMKGVKIIYGKNRSVKKAFFVGNDIVMIKYGNDDKLIKSIIDKVKKDKKKQALVNRSVKRILKIKQKYEINDNIVEEKEEDVKKINNRINQLREKM